MALLAFIDESGDHGMANIDPASPMFALTAAVYNRDEYITHELPSVARAKMRFWPHEGAVLHAYEIKKKLGPFAICTDPAVEDAFRTELCDMFRRSKAKLIAAVIDKAKHSAQYITPSNPYFLTVQFVLERIHMMAGNASKGTEIVFESRGKAEDKIVSEWCRRVCEGENHRSDWFDFKISFAKKASNVVGLQMADLACQPIIHYVQKPETQRPDWLAVKSCVRSDWRGRIEGRGLKSFP